MENYQVPQTISNFFCLNFQSSDDQPKFIQFISQFLA